MDGLGGWPVELTEIALCERMKCTWHQLQETPAYVVQDYLLLMQAEADAEEQRRRDAAR